MTSLEIEKVAPPEPQLDLTDQTGGNQHDVTDSLQARATHLLTRIIDLADSDGQIVGENDDLIPVIIKETGLRGGEWPELKKVIYDLGCVSFKASAAVGVPNSQSDITGIRLHPFAIRHNISQGRLNELADRHTERLTEFENSTQAEHTTPSNLLRPRNETPAIIDLTVGDDEDFPILHPNERLLVAVAAYSATGREEYLDPQDQKEFILRIINWGKQKNRHMQSGSEDYSFMMLEASQRKWLKQNKNGLLQLGKYVNKALPQTLIERLASKIKCQ